MRSTPPAILLGGQASSLSVARSLGRAGIEVIALGDAASSPARFSRHCARFVDTGSGEHETSRWLDWLRREGPPGAVLLPCTDQAVVAIALNRAALAARPYVLPGGDDDVSLAMLDKERTYELARDAGIRTPTTLSPAREEDAGAVAGEIGWPCALKPLHPIEFRRHFGLQRKLFVVGDEDEYARIAARTDSLGLAMLATEIIPGGDDRLWGYFTYIADDGRFLFDLTRRKLRQYPPSYGIGTYVHAVWQPSVADQGRRLLGGIGLHGIACVEFKRDSRNDELVLIECNHRFPNIVEIGPAAGVDMARIVYDHLVGAPEPPARVGHGTARLLMLNLDVRSFLISRRRGELTLVRWLRSLAHPLHFGVFRLDDPLPALAGAAAWVARRLRR